MKKWITGIVGFLLTFVVMAAVGCLGYRMGFARAASAAGVQRRSAMHFEPFAPPRGFERDSRYLGPPFQDREFADRRSRVGPGRMHLFPPVRLVVALLVTALLVWLGYFLYRRSAWRLVRIDETGEDLPAARPRGGAKNSSRKKRT